jgi:hypothetical protein
VPEIARLHAGREDQIVEWNDPRPDAVAANGDRAGFQVEVGDFGQHHRQVLLLTGELPDRRRDFGRREDRGCHLIQQWLENVVITPVDQKHFGIALPQRPRRGHAAKTATDYHDSRLPLGVRRNGSSL